MTLSRSSLQLLGLCLCSCFLLAQSNAANIGDGNPGMKVCVTPSNAIVIYQDEPSTVGIGLTGGMLKRHITVLFDPSHIFRQDAMDVPDQLYPLGSNAAFTCTGGIWGNTGEWEYQARTCKLYSLKNGSLALGEDAQQTAQTLYGLRKEEVFLGRIEDKIFFWKAFDPRFVYWRSKENSTTFAVKMPKGIIDLFGVTRGVKKEFGIVVFRHTPGLIHYAPFTHGFVEFRPSDGKPVHD